MLRRGPMKKARIVVLAAAGLFASAGMLGACSDTSTSEQTGRTRSALSTGLVISQVYGAGGNTSATYTNDFVEIFNRGATAVSLNGLSVQYASAAGSSITVVALTTTATIQPGRYYLLQLSSGGGVGSPLPTADQTGS